MLLSINFLFVGGETSLSHFLLSEFSELLGGIAREMEIGKPHELTARWQPTAFGNCKVVIILYWRRLADFQLCIKDVPLLVQSASSGTVAW